MNDKKHTIKASYMASGTIFCAVCGAKVRMVKTTGKFAHTAN